MKTNDNTCSCLECGETPTSKEEEKDEGERKQNTRRNDKES